MNARERECMAVEGFVMEPRPPAYRCAVCKGPRVEAALFVALNTNEPLDSLYEEPQDMGATWCHDCDDHTPIE